MISRRTLQILVATALLGTATVSAVPAYGSTPGADPVPDDVSFLETVEVPASTPLDPTVESYAPVEGAPVDVTHDLIEVTLIEPELELAATEWDADTATLTVYSAAEPETAEALLEEYGLSDADNVVVAPAARDAAELQQAVNEMIGTDGRLASGQQVALVIPSLDASSVEIVLDEATQGAPEVVLPDVGLDIELSYGPLPEQTTRVHAGPAVNAGAFMQNGSVSCSTGFRFTHRTTGTPAMGSAHHCGRGGAQWYYGTGRTQPLGQFTGGLYAGGATDSDTAVWSGAGVEKMVPGVFVGDHTAPGSAAQPIRGAAATTVGASVCYSGSRSGTVCNNRVERLGVTACYGNGLPCYNGLVLTRQIAGIPAVGQGDSGGPVYQSNGGILAAGVISGITNGTTTCTGDAGGRLCSARVLYAPITEFLRAGYSLDVVR